MGKAHTNIAAIANAAYVELLPTYGAILRLALLGILS